MKYVLSFLLLLLLAVFIGCSDDSTAPNQGGQFIGETKTLGQGTVQSWIEVGEDNQVTAVGLTLSENALNGLPAHESVMVLSLPQKGNGLVFDHIGFDWNPHGHDPQGVYTLPHFDVHFYMVSQQKRQTITAGPDMMPVDAKYVPQDYISTVDAVPGMGVHWIDPNSPELNGEVFTKTFIYGFYHGEMVFMEPMITVDYLKSKPDEKIALKQPQSFQKSGRYPQKYAIRYDANGKSYIISMTDFVSK